MWIWSKKLSLPFIQRKTMKILLITSILLLLSSCTLLSRDVAKRAANHVVKISDTIGSGTGFYLKYKGTSYLITNQHVCGDNTEMITSDGNRKVLKVISEHDLCLLESTRTAGLVLAHSEQESLDRVTILGHPMGQPLTAREGRFVHRDKMFFPWLGIVDSILVSVATFGGNSGSPALNDSGRVVGVLFANSPNTFEDSFLVPNSVLIKFLEKYRSYQK